MVKPSFLDKIQKAFSWESVPGRPQQAATVLSVPIWCLRAGIESPFQGCLWQSSWSLQITSWRCVWESHSLLTSQKGRWGVQKESLNPGRQAGIKRETDERECCFIALKINFMWLCVCVCFRVWLWPCEPRWPMEARKYWLELQGVVDHQWGAVDSTWVLCKRWKGCWPLGHLFHPNFLKINL